MKDVFAVQSDIARQVALHLDVVLTLDQANTLETAGTANPEAHDAYLRGLYNVGDLENEQDQLQAVRLFDQAVALDPAYLAPYVALARTNALIYHFGADRSPQRLAAARQARDQVAAIAPDRPETLVASAYVAFAEMKFAEAAAKLDAAGPGALYPFGRGFRADIARRLGRFEEALGAVPGVARRLPAPCRLRLRADWAPPRASSGGGTRPTRRTRRPSPSMPDGTTSTPPGLTSSCCGSDRSPARGPCSSSTRSRARATSCASAGCSPSASATGARPSRWRRRCPPRVPRTGAQRVPTSLVLAETYRIAGDTDAARRAFEASRVTLEREVEENPEDFRRYSALGLAYAGLGRRDDAVRSGERARALCPVTRDAVRGSFYLHDLALSHVMTGALDDAAATLETLLTGPHHPGLTPVLDLDPRWAPLRSHPAYPRLLSLVGGSPVRTDSAALLPAAPAA